MRSIFNVILISIALWCIQGCGGGTTPQQHQSAQVPTYTNWSTVKTLEISDSSVFVLTATAEGDYIYYSDLYNGLSTANVSDMSNIIFHNKIVDSEVSYGGGNSTYDYLYKFVTTGNIACIAVDAACFGWCAGDWTELRLYDITDKAKPIYLAAISAPLGPEDVLVEGNYLYVTGNNKLGFASEFNIIDITNPNQPITIGAVNINGPGKMAKRGTKIFISQVQPDSFTDNNYQNIQIIDVSNPSNPILEGAPTTISSFNTAYSPIAVIADVAYVSDWYNGLYVVDISDYLNPVLITTISQADAIYDIALHGSYLYLACGTAGLHIYDINKPEQPVLVKTINTTTAIKFVSVTSGKGAYITDAPTNQNNQPPEGPKLNIFYLEQ